ncbi:MAG TPA: CsbD family protein [Pseudonocardia sp.]
MGLVDKLGNKAQKLRGRIKRTTGAMTGDGKLEAEGRTDEVKSNLKQAGEKVKGAFRKRRGHRRRPK